MTCYIVDDEQYCISYTSDLIKETKTFTIIGTSTDPREAIAEIKELKPDVIFTDINMPHISGIDLATQVEHIGLVVFISSDMRFSHPQIDLQNSIFLNKPVSLPEFLKAVLLIKSRLNNR
ncbi:LytR/AlgR family response regulator transcription factor [Pedobacter alluvionis]|uniref:Response regulator n=1 Tax=Pedobacter alluvionis TaxID=475253 RepID=A0A497XYF8_9SPHI|nr:response regulator [Pedobacter alluvionis]RLJ75161.1 response regulator receiver domain-containing protein [Pedobacter alluvionis]TFB30262.1 response regulator [Pedobacter alluvionis]